MERNNSTPLPAEAHISLDVDSPFVDKMLSNVRTNVIQITEDKLEIILLKHLSKVRSRKAWITPLSLFITVFLAIQTATFTKTFGISAAHWEAIFQIGCVASLAWLLCSVCLVCKRWKGGSLEDLIETIKDTKETHN